MSIQAAAAEAVGDPTPVPVAEPPPRFILGSEAKPETIARLVPNRVVKISPTDISVENGFNARDFDTEANKAHVQRLSEMIAAKGVENPVRVRTEGHRIILVDGESRLRGVLAARARVKAGDAIPQNIQEIPVLLDPEAENEANRVSSLITKNSGKTFSQYETLQVVKRLLALGQAKETIQEELGMTRTAYNNLLLLEKAMENAIVLEYVKAGRVSATLVQDLMREHQDAEVVAEALKRAVKRIEGANTVITAKALKDGETEGTEATEKPEGVKYTMGNFQGAIGLLQKLYADLKPAADHKTRRAWIKNYLESINAPLTAPASKAETNGKSEPAEAEATA